MSRISYADCGSDSFPSVPMSDNVTDSGCTGSGSGACFLMHEGSKKMVINRVIIRIFFIFFPPYIFYLFELFDCFQKRMAGHMGLPCCISLVFLVWVQIWLLLWLLLL